MPKRFVLSTPEGNVKGLQAAMNLYHSLSKEEKIEHWGKYASLANAMTGAQRLQMDREKFELEKKLEARVEELERRLKGA